MYMELERKSRNSALRTPANDADFKPYPREDLDYDRSQGAAMRELVATLAVILAIVVAVNLLVNAFFPF